MPRRTPDNGRHRRSHRPARAHMLPRAGAILLLVAAAIGGLTANAAEGRSNPTYGSAGPLPGVEQMRLEASLRLNRDDSRQAHAFVTQSFDNQVRQREQFLRELMAPIWVMPIHSYVLTAGFGQASYLWSNRHTGQDFSAPYGTPVYAVGDGVVVFSGWDGPFGQKIVIHHTDGTETWYCHLSQIIIASGQVRAGEEIGLVGNTGNATGPHLHFEVHPNGGDAIDPLIWMRAVGLHY